MAEILSRPDLRALTGQQAAGAVVTATVAGEDAAYGLTRLDLGGETLWVGRLDAPLGTQVRLRIRARDVALALAPVTDVSIQNQLRSEVAAITADGAAVDVTLRVGDQTLWSQVTARAAAQLGLAVGQSVTALIRAVAIERRSVNREPRA